jgi:iron complex outermembrane receptor protein
MTYHDALLRPRLGASLLTLGYALSGSALLAAENTAAENTAGANTVEAAAETATAADDGSDAQLPSDRIVVSAAGVSELDLLAGSSVYDEYDIQREFDGQIGEVLAKLPGVSATGFAPGASRPVLRGFQGERVKVLIDGLSTADVSNTSADHATTIEPLNVERIEVLRGPAALLFGPQAIGGAVNVIDKRIARAMPQDGAELDFLGGIDTARDMRNLGAGLTLPIGNVLALHADGSYRKTDDLEIGGFQLAPALREELLEEAAEEEAEGEFEEAEEFREAAEQSGFIPNSASETYSFNAGLSLFAGDSIFGASVGYYNSDYGLPGAPGAGHHHEGEEEGEEEEGEEEGEEEEIVTIGLEQWRADALAEIDLGDGFFSKAKIRLGYSDYAHTEFEGDEVGTVYETESFEGRFELIQNDAGAARGSVGVQFAQRDFEAIGAEAFVAPNETSQFAVFLLQEYGTGPFQVEAAARAEFTDVEAQSLGIERSFTDFSGALGLVYAASENIRAGINVSGVERAPAGEELFANGPHIATQQFEIGDPTLRSEKALGVEGYIRGQFGAGRFNITAYQQWFDDYIYLSGTGEEEDELPVFVILQQDAKFFGIEAEASLPLVQSGDFQLLAEASGSYIEAELDDGTPVARIPPLELLGALEAQAGAFDVRGEIQWFGSQNDVDAFETPTDDFALVNFSLGYRPIAGDDSVQIVIAAKNIFDSIGRRHASFTKDFVPLAGRNISASVRLSF